MIRLFQRAHWVGAMMVGFFCGATFAQAEATHNLPIHYSTIVDGLDYAHLQTTNWNNGEPWSIHIARVDRKHKELRIAENLAHGDTFGVAPVSTIAGRFPKSRGEPLVGINAGFCIRVPNPYIGTPRGIGKEARAAMVIVDGEVVGAPSKYSFWINEDRSMHFGDIKSQFSAQFAGEKQDIGLNRECRAGDIVLFTHALGNNTRATNHFELVLENSAHSPLFWHVGETYSLKIKRINPAGNSPLSNSVCALTFSAEMADKAKDIHIGDTVRIDLATTPSLRNVVTACHAVFPIVRDGTPLQKFDTSAVMQHRNPRTAIGFNDRYFYMAVIDGRQQKLSVGMTAKELAEFMTLLGCREAMNLDGGGSSTFWMQGKTCNSVPGGRERGRADALFVVREPDVLGQRAAAK